MPKLQRVIVGRAPADAGRRVVVAGPLAQALKGAGRIGLACGNRRHEWEIALKGDRRGSQVLLPAEARALLHVPVGRHLHARVSNLSGGGLELRLGPVMGIFTSRNARGALFGSLTPYIRALLRYGRRLGMLVYVFTARDVDWSRGAVLGYVLGPRSGTWRRRWMPLPDVVHDKIQSRRSERRPSVQAVRERLQAAGVPWFPFGYLDKWRTHQFLENDEEIRKHLPTTYRLQGPEELRAVLSRHRTAYLKPTGGSLGLGIIGVHRLGGNRFLVRGGGMRRRVRGVEGVWHAVKRRSIRRVYIVQQGLQLARCWGRRFDVRVFMQKDQNDEWRRTKEFARLAPRGGLTSNLRRGGDDVGMMRAVRRAFGRNARGVAARLRSAGQSIAGSLEAAVPGHLGEVGVDLGVDRRGHVWLIEANSKPFRRLTRQDPVKVRLTIVRPLGYACFLAGFTEKSIEQGAGLQPGADLNGSPGGGLARRNGRTGPAGAVRPERLAGADDGGPGPSPPSGGFESDPAASVAGDGRRERG